ncbi:mannosyltransferase family protein [Lyngbya aestuarii BL J]|uniref:Mannosyltransferase family protein n=1 Tax=Lyngbya aestuarii BL J TaxID=1348334 RepID=U7QA25_9CYAN|nr:Npun_R2821/Npun_R2822 family protein [Lyngbya aestuarii]ERT04689.1 mannosyltransferase family protein [Lyngbya aestuarii BL J]
MSRGIYIVANDRVIEQTIALLNSVRFYDSETPIILIPFDENHQQVAKAITEKYNVKTFEDLEFLNQLCNRLHSIFGQGFFNNPNKHRKQACWFGPFDEFLYLDTDIVVFEKIIDNLNYFNDYDFLCCDYQHKGGIENVFTTKVLEDGVFTEDECKDIFNSGLWASKKGLFSLEDLYQTFEECSSHPEYFDFSQKTTDQPIFNYLILKRIPRRFNIVNRPGKAPGSWGGSPHFQRQGNQLFDPKLNQTLQYIHWAGIKIEPGCPYWDIWEDYRYLDEPKPTSVIKNEQKKDWKGNVINKIKKVFKS